MRGTEFDIIINSAMPSKKGIGLKITPLMIFRPLLRSKDIFYNWNYNKIVLVSSVSARCQLDHPYGINKRCAEELILKNENNLILRLGAMYVKV